MLVGLHSQMKTKDFYRCENKDLLSLPLPGVEFYLLSNEALIQQQRRQSFQIPPAEGMEKKERYSAGIRRELAELLYSLIPKQV